MGSEVPVGHLHYLHLFTIGGPAVQMAFKRIAPMQDNRPDGPVRERTSSQLSLGSDAWS